MGFYPHVNPNEPFMPDAGLSNNVRDLINGFGGGGERGVSAGRGTAMRWPVCNATDELLPAGASIEFMAGVEDSGVLPVREARPDATVWGILETILAPGEIGDAILSGPARINITGDPRQYAAPDGNGGYIYNTTGGAPVLATSGETAVVLLGNNGNISAYTGPFNIKIQDNMIAIASGFLNLNGDFSIVPAAVLEPATGYVCVCADWSYARGWGKPYLAICQTPAVNKYPVGYVELQGQAVNVQC